MNDASLPVVPTDIHSFFGSPVVIAPLPPSVMNVSFHLFSISATHSSSASNKLLLMLTRVSFTQPYKTLRFQGSYYTFCVLY